MFLTLLQNNLQSGVVSLSRPHWQLYDDLPKWIVEARLDLLDGDDQLNAVAEIQIYTRPTLVYDVTDTLQAQAVISWKKAELIRGKRLELISSDMPYLKLIKSNRKNLVLRKKE